MRHRHVLMVEDNYLLLDMLTGLCERSGIAVVSVSSGEAAIAAIRRAGTQPASPEGGFALLLTDINLPGLIDGWTVADAFRQFNPDCPVIYTSTSGCSDRRAVPDSVFLGKPFRIQDVVDLTGALMRTGPADRSEDARAALA
ncbi:response regulator [Methylobacterium sp. Leaf113]|uniref:response regulator n=1 Tax=Methylobacterium sp. Leaf113 TaxID=1736259 RepID=UPI0009E72607|nr:response regulator [Methylobacterium sp. Leaf113]